MTEYLAYFTIYVIILKGRGACRSTSRCGSGESDRRRRAAAPFRGGRRAARVSG